MVDSGVPTTPWTVRRTNYRRGRWVVILLIGSILAWGIARSTPWVGRDPAPPTELAIARITLPTADQVRIELMNGTSAPVMIAQVQIDDAYWNFTVQPSTTVSEGGRATIVVPYRWVHGDRHVIRIVTATGATLDGAIDADGQIRTGDS